MTRLVDDGLSEEFLAHRSEVVQDLVRNHQGWEFIRAELERRAEGLKEEILAGKLDADRYRHYSARLQEVMFVLQLPDELIRPAPEGGPDA